MDTDTSMLSLPQQRRSTIRGRHPDIPPEVLHIIFWYATRKPKALEGARRELCYFPFQNYGCADTLQTLRAKRDVWEVKTAISLVCKPWNNIATEFLYEEITIGPRVPSLEMLDLFGHRVRRLELQAVDAEHCSVRLIDVLSRCPRLEILAKLSSTDFGSPNFWGGFSSSDPSLCCLRRVDWTSSHPDCGPEICRASELAFMSIAAHSPNLNHLSSCSPMLGRLFDNNNGIPLSSLNVIRFPVPYADNPWFIQIPRCPLPLPHRVPCLTHVIINSTIIGSLCFLSQLPQLPQVTVLELQDGIFLEAAPLSVLFHVFSNCEELAIPAGHAHFATPGSSRYAAKKYHTSIKRIRLFASPFGPVRSLDVWMKLHVHVLFTEYFPAVDSVYLHGDWRFTVSAQLLRDLNSMLQDRSYWLLYENGSPVAY